LSGVAQFLESKTGDTYYAGLWKAHMIEDLHWRTLKKDSKQNLAQPARPDESRAPSWSWAAVNAKIHFRPLDLSRVVAEVLDCHIEFAGKNPFGAVSSGVLRMKVNTSYPREILCVRESLVPLLTRYLQAPIFEIKTKASKELPEAAQYGSTRGLPVEIYLDHGTSTGIACFDIEAYFPCFAMFLDCSNSLILRKKDVDVNTYQRIGTADFLRTEKQRSEAPVSGKIGKSSWTASHGQGSITDIYLQLRDGFGVDDLEGMKYTSPEISGGPVTSQEHRFEVAIV